MSDKLVATATHRRQLKTLTFRSFDAVDAASTAEMSGLDRFSMETQNWDDGFPKAGS
jgi:hypothetical protein